MIPAPIRDLIQALQTIPGVGEKTATRYALHLATSPNVERVGHLVLALPTSIQPCPACRALIVAGTACPFCTRASTMLCVVHRFVDLLAVERAASGMRYFVLGKLFSPLDGVQTADLPLEALRALAATAEEVVLALPSSLDGEATSLLLAKELRHPRVSRLARGLPHGGDIEFADPITMQGALQARTRVTT